MSNLPLVRISVLDHGYVEIIEHWGSDERIIESARMSVGKGFLGWGPKECDNSCIEREGIRMTIIKRKDGMSYYQRCTKCNGTGLMQGDEKLLRYLYTQKHTSPFEVAGATFETQAPIMVYREWHRHRTQSYNEMSARYTPLPDVNYIPTIERLMVNSKTNKQAGVIAGADELTNETALEWLDNLRSCYNVCEEVYQQGLQAGVPKELARLCVPVGRYSRMRASANLLNWIRFLSLRNHPKAQSEIREYAIVVEWMLAQRFPRTMALFVEERQGTSKDAPRTTTGST